jgi:hypothetical protein
VADRLADVSSLWTPGGEYPVGDRGLTDRPEPDQAGADQDTPDQEGPDLGFDLDPADEAALRAEMDEARARLAEVPAEVVVINHAMGLYELGAIHLSASPPDLAGAALAIDAFGCLVEGLGERMGPETATLRDALAQVRLAFVQIKGSATAAASPADPLG